MVEHESIRKLEKLFYLTERTIFLGKWKWTGRYIFIINILIFTILSNSLIQTCRTYEYIIIYMFDWCGILSYILYLIYNQLVDDQLLGISNVLATFRINNRATDQAIQRLTNAYTYSVLTVIALLQSSLVFMIFYTKNTIQCSKSLDVLRRYCTYDLALEIIYCFSCIFSLYWLYGILIYVINFSAKFTLWEIAISDKLVTVEKEYCRELENNEIVYKKLLDCYNMYVLFLQKFNLFKRSFNAVHRLFTAVVIIPGVIAFLIYFMNSINQSPLQLVTAIFIVSLSMLTVLKTTLLGQALSDWNVEITSVLQDLPWYNWSRKTKQLYLFFTVVAQIPVRIPITQTEAFDVQLLARIFNTAFSCALVILQLKI